MIKYCFTEQGMKSSNEESTKTVLLSTP